MELFLHCHFHFSVGNTRKWLRRVPLLMSFYAQLVSVTLVSLGRNVWGCLLLQHTCSDYSEISFQTIVIQLRFRNLTARQVVFQQTELRRTQTCSGETLPAGLVFLLGSERPQIPQPCQPGICGPIIIPRPQSDSDTDHSITLIILFLLLRCNECWHIRCPVARQP